MNQVTSPSNIYYKNVHPEIDGTPFLDLSPEVLPIRFPTITEGHKHLYNVFSKLLFISVSTSPCHIGMYSCFWDIQGKNDANKQGNVDIGIDEIKYMKISNKMNDVWFLLENYVYDISIFNVSFFFNSITVAFYYLVLFVTFLVV